MPIECGYMRADEHQKINVTHQDGEDICEIELNGRKGGGWAFCAFYFHRPPYAKRYVGSTSVSVESGEEKEILNTGIRVKGL